MGRLPDPDHVSDRYWSDDHRYLLYSVAEAVANHLDFAVDKHELVNVAWLAALRHRPPDKLHGCYNYLYRTMWRWALKNRPNISQLDDIKEPTANETERIDICITSRELIEKYTHGVLRRVMTWRYVKGWNQEKISERLKITNQCVSYYDRRGIRILRESLKGVFP
jgi:DNA-directed RNA polymerase specialized sigma24 family protein